MDALRGLFIGAHAHLRFRRRALEVKFGRPLFYIYITVVCSANRYFVMRYFPLLATLKDFDRDFSQDSQ